MQHQESSKSTPIQQAVKKHTRSVAITHDQQRLEEFLQQSERYFHSAFEQPMVGMAFIDPDGQVQRVNQHFCDMLGYARGELLKKPLYELTHPDDLQRERSYYESVLAWGTRDAYNSEKRYLRADGSYAWTHVTITPECDTANTVLYFSLVVQDIARMKQLETQLHHMIEGTQERTSQIGAIIDAMADHISLYDRDGNVMHVNFLMRDLIKTTPEDYVSQPLEERASRGELRGEDGYKMPMSQWPLTRILNGETIKGAQAVDLLYRLPEGGDVQVSISGAPIRNSSGEIVGAVCISRDVTERRKLERRTHEALNALVAMADALVQTSPTGSVDAPSATYLIGRRVVELTKRVLDCRRAGILTVSGSDIIPIATVGFSEEEEHAWFERHYDGTTNFIDLLSSPHIEVQLHAKKTLQLDLQESSFPAMVRELGVEAVLLAPIHVDEKLVGVLYIDRGDAESTYSKEDIALVEAMTQVCALINMRQRDAAELVAAMTTLQEANVQLAQLNKMQSNFIAMVGHEFRTTLTSIQGFSELLRDEQFDLYEVKEYASDIHTDALRLHRMINDLLDLERMKSGKMLLHLELNDLNEVLREVGERTGMVSPHHVIRFQLDDRLPRLESDRDKLVQVVANLLSNAIKYSPRGGEILVRSVIEGEHAHVMVQDHGIGIPREALEKVFTPYSRIDSEKTRYVQGTGLGLPIVRQIIEMHGGRVWAESSIGSGSTFHFTLPLMHVLATSPA